MRHPAMNEYEISLKPLDRFLSIGEKETINGSRLIGNPDKNKPFFWLIKIYAKLHSDEILNLVDKINIPDVYRNFLTMCCNGLDLFLGTLSLFGYRENMNRNPEDIIQQPFSILTVNLKERPKNSKEEYFFFGSYNWDGSYVYINKNDNCVYLCQRNDATPTYKWDSFSIFLTTEINRICSLMKDEGSELKPDNSTLPII